MSERPGRYQRSVSGMVGAMIVLVLVVGLFVAFRAINRNEPEHHVDAVDYSRPAEFAREQARFPILAPTELPEGWRATSVRFTNGRDQAWHVGFLTGADQYVGLEQADETAENLVEQHVDEEATEGDPVTIDGEEWQSWTDEGGDTALVKETDEVTTLVVGTAPQETLVEFVHTLR
ncbi:MAG TPA: DUF4245 domain-containing protein [Marmoricola sp.]|nr:DUF4245 domain-containing protein [Marmoricola sp.]